MEEFGRIRLFQGDITTLEIDAIVNAANSALQGGGGVDGAIHRKAGQELAQYNRIHLGKCKTGEAKVSPGFKLPAAFVIHTVGPVWRGGANGEPDLLASCYQNSLGIAAHQEYRQIAFPSISTGIYGFPIEQAMPIAISTVREFLENNSFPESVIFVCFSNADFEIYRKGLAGVSNP